jgi:acetyl-CoA carboxylase biotin carboxyl carrier protein
VSEPNQTPQPDQGGPDTEATLRTVLCGAFDLLASVSRPPSELRVRVGEVSVELSWPAVPTVATAPTAPADPPGPGHEHGLPRLVSLPVAGATAAAPDEAPTGRGDHAHEICSPTVGVFYTAPEPDAAPFVEVGDLVERDQQLGIVEAMKMMIPVDARLPGRVTAVLRPNAAEVEFGEPLFVIDALEG